MSDSKPTKRKVNYFLNADLVKKVKREAVEAECWPSEIVESALDQYLSRTKKPRPAVSA